jgi:hypothetical protein
MNIRPHNVIESIPAIRRDSELLPKRSFVIIIRYNNELDFSTMGVGSDSDANVVTVRILSVELVK